MGHETGECRASRRLAAFALAAALVLACAKNGKGNGGSTPPTVIDAATRTAVLDAAESALAAADGLDAATRQAQLLAFVNGHPEFADGGVTPSGDVWARFVDGGIVVIASDLDDPDPDALASSSGVAAASSSGVVRSALMGLPAANEVFLGTSLGAHYQGYLPTLEKMFTDKNYTVLAATTAEVDALKSFGNLAVLYLNTHGVNLGLPGAAPAYVLNTSTLRARDGSTDARYAADIADGSLRWFVAKAWDGGTPAVVSRHTTYAITPAFVAKYWSGKFAPGSFVFVNSCNSASSAAAAFRQAVLAAGATVYVGWSERTRGSDAVDTADYFFDRLLGANAFLPESPPQRPFPWRAVLTNMQARVRANRAYPFDTTKPEVTLTVVSHLDVQGGFGVEMLAPSIQGLQLEEPTRTLQIAGMFGDTRGEAFLESSSIPVTLWTAGLVVTDFSGAGTAGAVKIVGSYGPDSNPTPLTEWRGSSSYTVVDSGLTSKVTFNLHFRADVHGYRMAPGGAPVHPPQSFQHAMDSTGTYEFSGTYTSSDGLYTETWSGSGALAPAASVAATDGFFFQGNMDDTTWNAGLNAVATRHVHTVQSFTGGAPPVVQDYDEIAGGPIVMSDGSSFVAAVDGSLGIAGGDRSELLPSMFGGGATATATLHWDAMGAVNGPTPSTQRRRGPARRFRRRGGGRA